mgnify:CR=1 FL=1
MDCFKAVLYYTYCKIQEKELEEVKYFDIDEIADLDNEGVEWLDSLKKIVKVD